MTDDSDKRRTDDLISKARHQLGVVTSEFQRGLHAVRDPGQRRELVAAYLDTVEKYLAKAQDSLAKYRSGLKPTDTIDPHAEPSVDTAGSDQRPPGTS